VDTILIVDDDPGFGSVLKTMPASPASSWTRIRAATSRAPRTWRWRWPLVAFELAWVDAGAATGSLAGCLALSPIHERGAHEQRDAIWTGQWRYWL